MSERYSSYLSPKLEVRTVFGGTHYGSFATEPINAGEVLAVWGGEVMTLEQVKTQSQLMIMLSIQVEEDAFMVSTYPSPGDRINHSCDPNAWIEGQIVLVARRDIAAGEEVCFDYATCDGTNYDEFDCQCGSPLCRGRVTGDDWQIPELQERYRGHFMPYLQRRIDRLKMDQVMSAAAQAERRQRRIIRLPSSAFQKNERYLRTARRRIR